MEVSKKGKRKVAKRAPSLLPTREKTLTAPPELEPELMKA
jgi:hypothetical protein